jgi:hypothetical protein
MTNWDDPVVLAGMTAEFAEIPAEQRDFHFFLAIVRGHSG